MKRNLRRPGLHRGRCQPRCEVLEGRLVLSMLALEPSPASALPSEQTTADALRPLTSWPARGTVLYQSLQEVAVGFNIAFDPGSVWPGQDLVLYRVQDGGDIDWNNPITAATEHPDETDPCRLVATFDPPLDPGHYAIVLSGMSMLTGLDGEWLADMGTDQVLGDFTVARAGVSRNDAQPLPPLDPAGVQPTVVSGALDFTADPGAVALYSFTVPAGTNLWQVGLEVDAQRLGSALRSDLTLFDADGQVKATAVHGRPGTENDPYLFAGLAPGTYYVGISAANNVPGQPDGYDLATGARARRPAIKPAGRSLCASWPTRSPSPPR